MLKKIYRGLTRNEIGELKDKGEMVKNPLLGLLWIKAPKPKIGIVVSKRISKKAVERNRIRRVLMEAIRNNWKEWEKKSVSGLVLVRSVILGKGLDEVETEWKNILKRLF